MACRAAHSEHPTSGSFLWLEDVLSLLHGCCLISTYGISSLRCISSTANPAASYSLMPVSLIRATSHLGSSLAFIHLCWMRLSTSNHGQQAHSVRQSERQLSAWRNDTLTCHINMPSMALWVSLTGISSA